MTTLVYFEYGGLAANECGIRLISYRSASIFNCLTGAFQTLYTYVLFCISSHIPTSVYMTMSILKSRKENPQKLTQLSSRSHPRHLMGKRTTQKDTIIDALFCKGTNSRCLLRSTTRWLVSVIHEHDVKGQGLATDNSHRKYK